MDKPNLADINTKFYIRSSLKEIRRWKDRYITIFVNIFCFLFLATGIVLFLYNRYKGKLTPEEKMIKEKHKKQYLFTKLHKISNEKRKENQTLITDLPLI